MGIRGRERELQQWMEMEPHTQQIRAADSEPSDRRLQGVGLDFHLQLEFRYDEYMYASPASMV